MSDESIIASEYELSDHSTTNLLNIVHLIEWQNIDLSMVIKWFPISNSMFSQSTFCFCLLKLKAIVNCFYCVK